MSAAQRALVAVLPVLDAIGGRGGILNYHGIIAPAAPAVPSPAMHVRADTLRRQLEHVRERFDVLPLGDLLARRAAGRSLRGCCAITFDDAYAGIARHAHGVFRALDLPATVFVTAATAEGGEGYWWDRLEAVRRTAPRTEWAALLESFALPAEPPTEAGAEAVREFVLTRRGGRLPLRGDTGSADLRSLDFGALRALGADGRFTFGCHTLTHPALPYLEPADRRRELAEAHERLASCLPGVQRIVAYPYGLYDAATIVDARAAGMVAGVSTEGRALSGSDDVMALPRVVLGEAWTPAAISLRLSGAMRPVWRWRGAVPPRIVGSVASRPARGT